MAVIATSWLDQIQRFSGRLKAKWIQVNHDNYQYSTSTQQHQCNYWSWLTALQLVTSRLAATFLKTSVVSRVQLCILLKCEEHVHVDAYFIVSLTEMTVLKAYEVSVSSKLTVNGKLFVLPKDSPKKVVCWLCFACRHMAFIGTTLNSGHTV